MTSSVFKRGRIVQRVLFSISCTTCRAQLGVRDESAIGAILQCPKCGSMVQIVAPPNRKSDDNQKSVEDPIVAATTGAVPKLPPALPPQPPAPPSVPLELVSNSGWTTPTELLYRKWLPLTAGSVGLLVIVFGVWSMLAPGNSETPPIEPVTTESAEQTTKPIDQPQSQPVVDDIRYTSELATNDIKRLDYVSLDRTGPEKHESVFDKKTSTPSRSSKPTKLPAPKKVDNRPQIPTDIAKKLAGRIPEIDIQDDSLYDVVALLGQLSSLQIAFDEKSNVAKNTTVSVHLSNATVAEILTKTLSSVGLTYRVNGYGLVITAHR